MVTSLADESRLLAELRGLAEQGRHREVLDRLQAEPATVLEHRTSFALVAAHMRGEPQAQLRARNFEGAIALLRGDLDGAERRFAEALELARLALDHATQARCFNNLGIIAFLRGDPASALASYRLALAAYQQAGVIRGVAETHHNMSISWRELRDNGRALGAADQAVRLASEVRDDSLIGLALTGRAEVHLAMG